MRTLLKPLKRWIDPSRRITHNFTPFLMTDLASKATDRTFMHKRLAPRWLLATMLSVLVTSLGLAGWLVYPYAKVSIYDYQIRHHLRAVIDLGRLRHVAGEAALEAYATAIDPEDRWATDATWALCTYYPDSRITRGVREYKEIVHRPVIGNPKPAIEAAALRTWIKRYEPHPSTDDAYLVLARETEQLDPIEALRILHLGFHSPDGDAHDEIANRFQMILERRSAANQLQAWLESDCPGHIAANIAYVAGIKRMRLGQYRDALPLLDRFVASLAF